jgi:hypothetical protein
VELTSKPEIEAMQSCPPEELVEKKERATKLGFGEVADTTMKKIFRGA